MGIIGDINMKKPTETHLDSLWRNRVYERCYGRCIMCGSTSSLECHHIIKRRFRNTRWDINNGALLCQTHHIFAESHPREFAALLDKKYGEGFYDGLKKQGNQIFDGNYGKWEEQLEEK